MAEEKDYVEILNKARRRRKQSPYRNWIIAGAVVAAVVLLAVIVVQKRNLLPKNRGGEPVGVAAEGTEGAGELSEISAEEEASLAAEQEAAQKQAVVDSYENLGLVQLQDSGYLNVREKPGQGEMAIGKLMSGGACEILGSETVEDVVWYHITSGGVEGYISSQFVVTGEEARQKALEYVTRFAIVDGEKLEGKNLNVRSVPDDSTYETVVGQVLADERYAVEEELDGWVKIASGYISADYVKVEYALNEARKLDKITMAVNQYHNLFVSKVSGYQNVRSEPKLDGNKNIIGKLTSMAGGEILEKLDGWYKIKSGNITGYVAAEHVATGPEARDLALQNATLMAIVNTDKLNVRSEPDLNAEKWTQISKEERYAVVAQLDGWVEIELDAGDGEEGEGSNKAFVSTRDNNVEVRYALNEAIKFSPLEEKANQQASLRSKVVNYGLQFVGNRYVWGGTNPNTGADCSGFVQYVMRNAAGVSLPRTSREQAKTGRSIKSSEMRPGDLIYYTNKSGVVNHVAMYIGNGQIVHAASRRSGIKISTWNYRTPKYIRSYLD
ncbi:MAG: SH3 domain-containing protein [Eubacteriales bacterium]|nr:SH3 domain-containing protein [Eubacteriales bacterium]